MDEQFWPKHDVKFPDEMPEQKANFINLVSATQRFDLFTRYSSLTKLQRVIAYIFRFTENCKINERYNGHLSVKELDQ